MVQPPPCSEWGIKSKLVSCHQASTFMGSITPTCLCSTPSCALTLQLSKIKASLWPIGLYIDLYDPVLACFSFPPSLPLGHLLRATLVFFKYSKSGSCLSQCPYIFSFLYLKCFPLNPYNTVCLIVLVRILLTYVYCLPPPLEHGLHEARNVFLSIVVFPDHRIVPSI